MSLPPELIICCNTIATGLFDLQSGSSVLVFKQGQASSEELASTTFRQTTTFVEAKNGVGGLVMGLHGPGKGAVNMWSFAKESAIQRCILPVKLACIALSKTGNYLVGGTETGQLLLWETGTGDLIAVFDAHYRAVTCLAWTQDDDGAFLSGSDDTTVHVWSLASILAGTTSPGLRQSPPYASLRDHTLPISDMAVGTGRFPRVRVLTASVDTSCKLWDLQHPTASLLMTFTFPAPFSDLSHVVVDELERFFLVAAQSKAALANGDNQAGSSGLLRRVDLYRRAGSSAHGDSTWAMGELVQAADAKSYSTSSPVTSLHLSRFSPSLLVGLQTGQILVLALPSLQLLRTILPSPLPAPAVTFVATLLRPPDLIARANLGERSAGAGEDAELPARPVGMLSRTVQDPEKRQREHTVHVRLTNAPDVTHIVAPPLPPSVLPSRPVSDISPTAGSDSRVSELQVENAKLREQLARATGINDAMWNQLVSTSLASGIQLH